MKLIQIISAVFFVIAVALGFLLYKNIEGPITERKQVKRAEARKIDKLKMLREVQKSYLDVHGKYASHWDSLITFVQEDTYYTVEKSEEIFVRQYGGDSIVVNVDTIDAIAVKDLLFPESDFPNFNAETLPFIPGNNKKFKIYADKIEKNNVMVDVFEITDVEPISMLSELRSKGEPLRVGSRSEVTTSGNWE
ncbi:MAG: hypothetical protein RH860_09565 [Cytophagales bacterium]